MALLSFAKRHFPALLLLIYLTAAVLFPAPTQATLLCADALTPVISLSEGSFAKDYRNLVQNLQAGQRIRLPGGHIFVVHGILGNGQLTKVVDIGDGWALRLPLFADDFKGPESINEYFKMQQELKAAGVSVVEMDMERSEPPFGVVVRKENFLFKANEFLAYEKGEWPDTFSQAQIERAREQFSEFLKRTWLYIDISDVTAAQIGFNGQQWVLFDFFGYDAPMHMPLRNFNEDGIVLGTRSYDIGFGKDVEHRQMPQQLEDDLHRQINETRRQARSRNTWYEREDTRTSDSGELIDRVTPHPLPEKWHKTYDSEHLLFKRDLSGYRPQNRYVNIEVEKFLTTKNNIAIYDATINKSLNGDLYIVVDGKKETWQIIEKLSEEAEKNHRLFLHGTDFIFIYKNQSGAELKKI